MGEDARGAGGEGGRAGIKREDRGRSEGEGKGAKSEGAREVKVYACTVAHTHASERAPYQQAGKLR